MRHAIFKVIVISVAIVCAVPSIGLAQTGLGRTVKQASQQLHQKFLKADKDKDGFLTLDEARAGNLRSTTKHFADIDTERTGKVSEKQIQDYFAKRAVMQSNAKQ
jgi:low affinity Fe/Cu permease